MLVPAPFHFYCLFSFLLLPTITGAQVEAELEELPGKEHWWWDSVRDNDGGVTNDASMRRFFRAAADRSAGLEQAAAAAAVRTTVPTTGKDEGESGRKGAAGGGGGGGPLMPAAGEVTASEAGLLEDLAAAGLGGRVATMCANAATCGGRFGVRVLQVARPMGAAEVTFVQRPVAGPPDPAAAAAGAAGGGGRAMAAAHGEANGQANGQASEAPPGLLGAGDDQRADAPRGGCLAAPRRPLPHAGRRAFRVSAPRGGGPLAEG